MDLFTIFSIATTVIDFVTGLFQKNKAKEIEKKQEELTQTELEANLSTLDYNINIMEQNIEALTEEKEYVLGKGEDITGGQFGIEYKQKKGSLINALAASGIKLGKGTAAVQESFFESQAQAQREEIERQFDVAIETASLNLEQFKSEYDIYKEYYDKYYGKKPEATMLGAVIIANSTKSINREREKEIKVRKEREKERRKNWWEERKKNKERPPTAKPGI